MITNKELRYWLLVVTLFSAGMFVFGFWAGNKHCEQHQENYCQAPRVETERIEIPVGDEEIIRRFVECRRDLIELSEAVNSDINCHDKTCE